MAETKRRPDNSRDTNGRELEKQAVLWWDGEPSQKYVEAIPLLAELVEPGWGNPK